MLQKKKYTFYSYGAYAIVEEKLERSNLTKKEFADLINARKIKCKFSIRVCANYFDISTPIKVRLSNVCR